MERLEGTCWGSWALAVVWGGKIKAAVGEGEQRAAPGCCAEEARVHRVTFREPWEGTRADQGEGHGGQVREPAKVHEPPGGRTLEAINGPALPFWGRREPRRWLSGQLEADPVRPAVVACALPAAALASRSLRAEPWEEAGLWLVFACSRVRPVSPPRPQGSALAAWPQPAGGSGIVRVSSLPCGHRSGSPPLSASFPEGHEGSRVFISSIFLTASIEGQLLCYEPIFRCSSLFPRCFSLYSTHKKPGFASDGIPRTSYSAQACTQAVALRSKHALSPAASTRAAWETRGQ